MKTKILFKCTLFLASSMLVFIAILAFSPHVTAQPVEDTCILSFTGQNPYHEGFAAWQADGTGPEPAGLGHLPPIPGYTNYYFYAASRDYDDIDPDPDACLAHMNGITGFPLFLQSMQDNGYSFDQLRIKTSLYDLGDDEEGFDWFVINDWSHAFYYSGTLNLLLNEEPLASFDFLNVDNYTTLTLPNFLMESSYARPDSAWENSCSAVQAVGRALFKDLDGQEIRLTGELTFSGSNFSGNGRDGAYYNTMFQLEKGMPVLPYQGLAMDHEGAAGWQADGTGPEPAATGHIAPGFTASPYYAASRDYDGIDPDPDAAFGHFLEDMSGFNNLKLQLAYRGFSTDQFKMKTGLCSLGDDVEGEDWAKIGEEYWNNYYNGWVSLELDGTPILSSLDDTLCISYVFGAGHWQNFGTVEKPRKANGTLSPDEEIIADAFLKDLEERHIFNEIYYMSTPVGFISGNGRTGNFFNIDNARLVAKCGEQCTFIQCDSLCSTMMGSVHWSMQHSPYYVDNDLVLAEGEELLIDPGVKVMFRGPYSIDIKGNITAIGDSNNMITFSHSNPIVQWTGMLFQDIPEEADSSYLSYCIFEHGFTDSYLPIADNSGGAIKMAYFDKLAISHCIFRDNEAFDPGGTYFPSGGAIALWQSSPLIEYSTFDNNHARYGGAIICYLESNPMISHCTFSNNTADMRGGAVIVYEEASPVIEYNHFFNNEAASAGGAISVEYSSEPQITFNLIHHNIARTRGGGIFISDESLPNISFNTIAYNQADTTYSSAYGGGICVNYCNRLSLEENILWGNMAHNAYDLGHQLSCSTQDTVDCYFNDIEGGVEGIGPGEFKGEYLYNIDANPVFCFVEDMIYTLADGSPCLTAGSLGGFIGAFDFGCFTDLHENKLPYNQVKVYPNPVCGGSISLFIEIQETEEIRVSIFNNLGQEVMSPVKQSLPAGANVLDISLPEFRDGTYICRIIVGDKIYTSKIFILK